MDRTHTGKFDGESVRGRQAECAVRRQILSPGTAKLRRVLRTKQPKRSRGSGLPFASPLRRAQQKQGTATTRGKEFLTCAAGRNGFPLERVVFDTPNNAGAGRMADPRRGTLSFVTQKFFCFGAINNRRNIGSIPLCRHIGWVFYPSAQVVSGTCPPLISSPGMVPRGCYK